MIKGAWVLKCSKNAFTYAETKSIGFRKTHDEGKKCERPRTRELDLPSCFYYTEPISTHSLGSAMRTERNARRSAMLDATCSATTALATRHSALRYSFLESTSLMTCSACV